MNYRCFLLLLCSYAFASAINLTKDGQKSNVEPSNADIHHGSFDQLPFGTRFFFLTQNTQANCFAWPPLPKNLFCSWSLQNWTEVSFRLCLFLCCLPEPKYFLPKEKNLITIVPALFSFIVLSENSFLSKLLTKKMKSFCFFRWSGKNGCFCLFPPLEREG